MKASSVPKRATARQRENAEARIELAMEIVQRFEAEAHAKGLSSGWQQPALETLLPLSLKALEHVSAEAVTLDSLAAVSAGAANDPSLLGDPEEDLVYTPITPCRFIDTRLVGGPITGTRDYDLDVNGSAYGGTAACNPTATLGASGDAIGAIAANLTIVSPALAPGFLAVKPTAGAPLSSLLNWYQAGPSVQVANAGIFQTANGVANFTIQTSASTEVIMDLLGAFIEPEATALQTTVVSAFANIPNNSDGGVSSPTCTAGYIMTGGGCGTEHTGHGLENSEPAANAWFCYSNNKSGFNPSELTAYAVCSRVPGR